MNHNIHFVNVDQKEKVLKALVLSLESGFGNAFKAVTQKRTFTSCARIEKTSLQAMLKAATRAEAGIEVRYARGLEGNALLLVRMNDLFRLGDVLLGAEGKIDDAMSPEVMEACVRFFAQAFIEANRHFAEQHGAAIESLTPELVNADGKPAGLQPLSECYDGVLCATFEFVVEPNIDSRFQLLVQAELLQSLLDLLPRYEPEPHVASEAERRRAMHMAGEEEAAEAAQGLAPLGTTPAGPPPGARTRQDRASGNWNIDLLLDVELPIVVSFGETEMPLKDILKFGAGSVIELNKSVNDPVIVKVNEKPIARGEVVMVDGNYGVRILEVESTAERLRSLG